MTRIETTAVLACALLASAAASGGRVVSSNAIGVLRVESGHKATAVAVPWRAPGGAAAQLTDLVDGAALSAGDEIRAYSGTSYAGFDRAADGGWERVATATEKGTDDSADAPVAAGSAIWVMRGDTSKAIYLRGEAAAEASTTLAEAGTADAPAYSLAGNPNAAAFTLNGSGAITGMAAGDMIIVPAGTSSAVYTYDGAAWGYDMETVTERVETVGGRECTVRDVSTARTTSGEMTIPAGAGFWYVSKGGRPTFNW